MVEIATRKQPNRYPWEDKKQSGIYRFFDGLEKGKLLSTKSKRCHHFNWPPMIVCTKCLSDQVLWRELPKGGQIIAYSLSYIGNSQHPELICTIELSNGLRMLGRIIGSKYKDLSYGLKVTRKNVGLVEGRPFWTYELVGRSKSKEGKTVTQSR